MGVGVEKKDRETKGKVTSRTGISTWKVAEDTDCGNLPHRSSNLEIWGETWELLLLESAKVENHCV